MIQIYKFTFISILQTYKDGNIYLLDERPPERFRLDAIFPRLGLSGPAKNLYNYLKHKNITGNVFLYGRLDSRMQNNPFNSLFTSDKLQKFTDVDISTSRH